MSKEVQVTKAPKLTLLGILEAAITSIALWASIIILPLALTYNDNYRRIFSESWYDETPKVFSPLKDGVWPSPVGLSLGISAVAIGQVAVLIYFILWKFGYLLRAYPQTTIQKVGTEVYDLPSALRNHLSQPEGFVLLGGYLIVTWIMGWMPSTYYDFSGGIQWGSVFAQLYVQDTIQHVMHRLEHVIHPAFYRASHKPHHVYVNPKMFDAFDGSFADTLFMILIPLVITARIVPSNVWSYMTFGSLYANWLTMIHSEFHHPWDPIFHLLGFGTAAHHHVHHKLFKFNFGHLFMHVDMLAGTYRSPRAVSQFWAPNEHDEHTDPTPPAPILRAVGKESEIVTEKDD